MSSDRSFLKKHAFGIAYGLALTAFTAYAIADAFVIPHRYTGTIPAYEAVPVSSADPAAALQTTAPASSEAPAGSNGSGGTDEGTTRRRGHSHSGGRSAESTPQDAAAEVTSVADTKPAVSADSTVTLQEYRYCDTSVYVADITLSSPAALKTAFAEDTYGRNIKAKTSEIADAHNAVLAINGDFYGARTAGYVIRNGVLFRNTGAGNEDLVIYGDGDLRIIREDEFTAEQLLEDGAEQVLSFGPGLLENGEILVDAQDEVGRSMASNPRTAIGMIEPLHYVFVVSDGRTGESEGLSLMELASFMKELGVSTAYNLDGGGSSTMIYQGSVINHPTTGGNSIRERSVSDIVYIAE